MSLQYEDIYSKYYLKQDDPKFFQLSKTDAYEMMRSWLDSIAALPYVSKIFSKLNLDDEIEELTYVLKHSMDSESDDRFVKELFAQGMVICWLTPKVESIENVMVVLGTKEEKRLQSNYKTMVDRLDSLEIKLRKYIRDYGYIKNSYLEENS